MTAFDAPNVAHLTPSQKDRKDDPSVDLPAAKRLLEFPPLTSTAETGPGISAPEPTGTQVAFSKL